MGQKRGTGRRHSVRLDGVELRSNGPSDLNAGELVTLPPGWKADQVDRRPRGSIAVTLSADCSKADAAVQRIRDHVASVRPFGQPPPPPRCEPPLNADTESGLPPMMVPATDPPSIVHRRRWTGIRLILLNVAAIAAGFIFGRILQSIG